MTLFSFVGHAHQPKLIYNNPGKNSPYEVIFPEISKAFYGKLQGEPHYFRIKSDKDFLFYTGILSPKVGNDYKWLSIDVIDNKNNTIFRADGKNFDWESWYEPYARDYYCLLYTSPSPRD